MMFEKKVREPALSKEIEAIIKRSQGEETSPYPMDHTRSDDIYRYKYRVMRALLSNEDLLRTLHHDPLSMEVPLNGDNFKDVCIFDYLRLPDLQEEVKNYVCFDVYTQHGAGRGIEIILQLRVVSHFEETATDWNINRQDLMDLIISQQFDWSHMFGGITMYKNSDMASMTNKGFCYRDIVYRGEVANNYHGKVSH